MLDSYLQQAASYFGFDIEPPEQIADVSGQSCVLAIVLLSSAVYIGPALSVTCAIAHLLDIVDGDLQHPNWKTTTTAG